LLELTLPPAAPDPMRDEHDIDDDLDPEGPSAADLERFGGDEADCPACGASVYHDMTMCPACGADMDGAPAPEGAGRRARRVRLARLAAALALLSLLVWLL